MAKQIVKVPDLKAFLRILNSPIAYIKNNVEEFIKFLKEGLNNYIK